jgi:hypothetical protein
LPLLLGLAQALVAGWLVVVELAQPAPEPGFGGIAFSNAIVSRRARATVELFRERLDWPRDDDDKWVTLSPSEYLWGKRLGVAALAAIQVAALVLCLAGRGERRLWPWLVGPGASLLILLLAPPVSSDVFYYADAGSLARAGLNPYLIAPAATDVAEAFGPYDDWAHITTPYGPVWTTLSRLVLTITGNDPFRAALGFKTLASLSALVLAVTTAALAGLLVTDRRLAIGAAIVVAWQPVLLLESAQSAHLDAAMMLLALTGLLTVASRQPGGVRGGLTLIAAGALIKPVVAPLLALAALWRLTERRGDRHDMVRLGSRWAGDLAAVAAVVAVAFAPYWSGGDLWRTLSRESKRLYLDEPLGVNAFWFWLTPRLPLVPSGDPWLEFTHSVVRPATAIATFALLAGAFAGVLVRSWPVRFRRGVARPAKLARSSRAPLWDQVVAWAVTTAALGMLPVNAHAWYAIWPLAPVALAGMGWIRRHDPRLAWRGVPWWLWGFLAWCLFSFLVYHTHV